jgi:hypothetical protein
MHCAVCCGSLSGLVFTSELLRVRLVLKIVLMLYRFLIRLNYSETGGEGLPAVKADNLTSICELTV